MIRRCRSCPLEMTNLNLKSALEHRVSRNDDTNSLACKRLEHAMPREINHSAFAREGDADPEGLGSQNGYGEYIHLLAGQRHHPPTVRVNGASQAGGPTAPVTEDRGPTAPARTGHGYSARRAIQSQQSLVAVYATGGTKRKNSKYTTSCAHILPYLAGPANIHDHVRSLLTHA